MTMAASSSMMAQARLLLPGAGSMPHRRSFRTPLVKASPSSSQQEDCNDEECAPTKEVGKVSMEWVAEDNTKVAGTYPPLSRQQMSKWTGYVEKDTAGQTNIYSIEPTIYVAESALSSNTAGSSTEGSDNVVSLSIFIGLTLVLSASLVLNQVGKNAPLETAYTGPSLSYYVQKFKPTETIEVSTEAVVPLEAPTLVSIPENESPELSP